MEHIKKLTKEERAEVEKQAQVILWCLRCNFIMLNKYELTGKGKSIFSPSLWRFFLHLKCLFNNGFKKEMIKFLRQLDGDEILSTL